MIPTQIALALYILVGAGHPITTELQWETAYEALAVSAGVTRLSLPRAVTATPAGVVVICEEVPDAAQAASPIWERAHVWLLSVDDGSVLWHVGMEGGGSYGPQLCGGNMVLVAPEGLRAIEVLTGQTAWTWATTERVSQALGEGSCTVAMLESGDGTWRLVCIDSTSGQEIWTTRVPTEWVEEPQWILLVSVGVDDEHALVWLATRHGSLFGVGRDDGLIRHRLEFAEPQVGSLVGMRTGHIFVGATRISYVDMLQPGVPRWVVLHQLGMASFYEGLSTRLQPISYHDGRVLAASPPDGVIRCLDAESGEQVWVVTVPEHHVLSALVATDGHLVYPVRDLAGRVDRLQWHDIETGALAAESSLPGIPGHPRHRMAADANGVYVATENSVIRLVAR